MAIPTLQASARINQRLVAHCCPPGSRLFRATSSDLTIEMRCRRGCGVGCERFYHAAAGRESRVLRAARAHAGGESLTARSTVDAKGAGLVGVPRLASNHKCCSVPPRSFQAPGAGSTKRSRSGRRHGLARRGALGHERLHARELGFERAAERGLGRRLSGDVAEGRR
jgi:hypothetical protein